MKQLVLMKDSQKHGRQGNKTTDCDGVYNQNALDRGKNGCILPFPEKGDLGIAKNYRGTTLTSNVLLLNRIEPKIENLKLGNT